MLSVGPSSSEFAVQLSSDDITLPLTLYVPLLLGLAIRGKLQFDLPPCLKVVQLAA